MKLVLVALATFGLVSVASAQNSPRAHVRQVCAADVQRLCGGARRPGQCLRVHAADLSQACKDALVAAHLKAKEIKPNG